jgi:hypothetical protein
MGRQQSGNSSFLKNTSGLSIGCFLALAFGARAKLASPGPI